MVRLQIIFIFVILLAFCISSIEVDGNSRDVVGRFKTKISTTTIDVKTQPFSF